ncbi:phosphatidate cytidylyltransferase [Celerinatantimonas diazotrophica]|uniref:Phosphatidate cytidylyltransferase n=1 Tax=Celerinatantimonas diazotrophica TaxID=412034 RepID=A0A4R1J9M3_9GAMM|nr:phosphatidate cytidylyltransferase [Celerinatantimonas diazotrophica]TCK47288.1 phosphatidate cytidylyltransferase [Celerinatantimonas diazotrophica]CAG9296061.1 Phosphatidate cytidylyltransferase [Celerinatantimonas diazotrophica]
MLRQRIITALLLAPIAIICIFFLPIKGLAVLLSAIVLIASYEWSGLVSRSALTRTGITVTLAFFWFASFSVFSWQRVADNSGLIALFFIAVIFWLLALLLVLRYPDSAQYWSTKPLLKCCAGLLALIPFGWSMLILRNTNTQHSWIGALWVVYVMALVWAADTGAYFAGRRFGRIKLAQKVSPNKTIEGLAGGLIAAMVICLLVLTIVNPDINGWVFFGTSVLTALVSVLGDLFESMLKREANIKDSGSILPGHGGILDRIDSLTAALPVFTFCYLLWVAL